MSTKYKAIMPGKAYFLTMTIVGWIDIFTRLSQRFTIINSLKYCQTNKGLEIYAYCLMPSHLHLMCRAPDEIKLFEIIRDFKKFTSKQMIKNINEENESRREWLLELFARAREHLKRNYEYKVWQDGYHAEILETNKFIYQKLDYIHMNPVIDKIVDRPEEYLFSSARNYSDLPSFLDVIVLPHEVKTIR